MAVVIRLQGLPLVAGSADIRRFFSGLNIPDGGVHIIGGEKGEAFVIFSTDEDARQAMDCSGGFIKDSRIQFFLSSKAEMQSIIEINRKRFGRGGRGGGPRRTGHHNSGTPDLGNLSNMVQGIKKGIDKSSHDSRVPLEDEFHSKESRNSNTNFSKLHFNQPRQEASQSDRLYLFLRGIPYSSTEDDLFNFFSGLQVEKVLLLKNNGRNNGDGLVKFATVSDAMKGMERDRNYIGSRFIVIRPSNEGTWIKHGGIIEEKTDDSFHFQHNLNKGQYFSNTEHPKKEPSYLSRKRTRSRTPPRRVVSQVNSRSPSRRITEYSYSKSPSQTVMAHAFSRSPQRDMAHAFSRSPQRDVAHAFSRSPQRDMAHTFSRSPPRDVAHAFSRSPRDVAHAFSRSPPRDVAHAFSRSPRDVAHAFPRSSPRDVAHAFSRSPPRDVAHAFSRSPQRDVAHTFSRSPQRDMPHAFSRSPQRDVAHAFSRSPQREMPHAFSRSPQRDVAHAFSRSQRDVAHAFSRSPQRDMAHTSSRSPPRRVTARNGSKSPRRVMEPMHSHSPRRMTASTHSRSPRRVKTHSHSPFSAPSQSHSPQDKEYYIYLKNLSAAVKKKDLREFFEDPTLANKDITFLKSHYKAENKDAIITFRSEEAYTSSLSYHKLDLLGQQVYIFPVSKKRVLESIGSSEVKRSAEGHRPVKDNQDGYVGPKTCVYVRNFPFDVTKVEVQKFFAGFNIEDDDIYLLYDDKGVGLGEALVKFRTENQARKAESLNRRCFLGTEVLLRCIPEEQMQEFGINISSASNEKMQGHHHSHERNENFYSVDSQGHSVQEGDYRNLSDDYICTCDRGSPQFGDGVPGDFSDSGFVPDSNFGGGSDSVTFIKLKNVPFRASPNEILDFFHGYKIIPDSLSVQHNEYGMFSGEAIIALINFKEAEAAINELNERPIGQRKVRLTFV